MAHDVTVFHPGVQHSWQTALALQQLDRLSFYATSIFYQPDRWPYRIERFLPRPLAMRAHAEFARFAGPPLDRLRLRTFGTEEWAERLSYRMGFRRLAASLDRRGNRRFGERLARAVETADPAVLWGYNGSSASLFRTPAASGRTRVLDRTIGDWRAYNAEMDAIRERFGAYFLDPSHRIDQRQIDMDDEEYALSDVILAGSSFAADTVRQRAGDPATSAKVKVLHYCFDEALFAAVPPPMPRDPSQPLRFLMLGQANVRKGVHLALQAFDRVPVQAATLTIVGDLQVPATTFARHAERVEYRRTVARRDVPALLAGADVLLFPSYFEGAGLVLYEALAAGCALLQSRHAAMAVTPATGVVLDKLSVDAVYDAVMAMVEDRPRVTGYRLAAPLEAQRYTFGRYRDAIASLLTSLELA